jgi:hypothetical protein
MGMMLLIERDLEIIVESYIGRAMQCEPPGLTI